MIEWRFLQTLTKDKRSRETPFSEKNGVAATLFCRIVQEEGGVVLNTSKGGEATFASSTGNLSRSYDIAVPGTMLNGMVQCRVSITEKKNLCTFRGDWEDMTNWLAMVELTGAARVQDCKLVQKWSHEAVNTYAADE